MKAINIAGLALALISVEAGCVADNRLGKESTTDQPPTKVVNATPQQNPKTALTGSYIKREIRQNGQITDGPNPVLVLDDKSVQNSGASDLRQLLIRQGVSH